MEIKLTDGPFGRNPNCVRYIIVHCSATPRGRDIGAREIRAWHLQRGFNDIGYHYVVRLDGTIEAGRSLGQIGAHCLGKNACSIGICYVGGVESDGKIPADTRTDAQRRALDELIASLRRIFPRAEVRGHRDFAAKACPSFNATAEYARRTLAIGAIVAGATLFASCGTKKAVAETLTDSNTATFAVSTNQTHSESNQNEIVDIQLNDPILEITSPDSTRTVVRARSATIKRKAATTMNVDATETRCDSTVRTTTTMSHTAVETRRPGGSTWLGTLVATVGAILLFTFFLKSKS